ncbi:MAG: hypothetical protein IH610_11685 [Deltaproteobacteria bacterium]|nr:hypothetical protein [Deltaproteobacteria bacterium]
MKSVFPFNVPMVNPPVRLRIRAYNTMDRIPGHRTRTFWEREGDREGSTKELARAIGAKSVTPCSPETAHRHSGYVVGGISPFGTRHPMTIYMEGTILDLSKIYINGGRRGFLVGMRPGDIARILPAVSVHVAI